MKLGLEIGMEKYSVRWFVSRFGTSIGVVAGVLMMTLCVAPQAFGQFGSGLTGTVADATKGAIPNATVTLTNIATQQSLVQTTGPSGVYGFPTLAGGTYIVTVEAAGFKKNTIDRVAIAAETTRNLDVTLVPGGNTETVTVNADDTVALQSSDASIGTTIDNEQFEKVPSYGRDPYNLLRTAPGITGDGARSGNGSAVFLPNSVGPGGSNFGIAQAENTVQISANGQRITDNNFEIDGVSVNSLGYGGAAVVTPNIEAIGSISVLSTSFSAEDGRNTGAQIKTVTKAGTNKLHGGGFFQYDEPGLNAFNKYGGPSGQLPTRVQIKSRDFAVSVGGPLIKDKLFGFFAFERSSQVNSSYSSQYVDTPQFRALIHADRPGSIADAIANQTGSAPRIRTVLTQSCTSPSNIGTPCAVVNGGIDLGSPIGAKGTYVPLAQAQSGGGLDGIPDVQYVQTVSPGSANYHQYVGRVDYFVTPKDQLAASFYSTKLNDLTNSPSTRPAADVPFNPQDTAATFIFLHTFGPSLLNEFRTNYTRFNDNGVSDASTAGVNFGIPFINIQNENFNNINNVQYGANFSTTTPAIFAENTYELRDTVTKVFGPHTLKLGFVGRLEQNDNNLLGGSRPGYAFAGQWNFFNDAPIFEEIYANPATGGPANASRHFQDHYYAGFVQHDWKATSALTLNMGLRWEYFEPIYNKGMNINYPQLGTTPGLELINAGLYPVNHLYQSHYGDFSPKAGFAFAPAALHGKTVFRGGFAMAYNRLDDVLFDPALEDGPGIFDYNICCGTSALDFSTPFDGGQITYGVGTSNSPASFAPNPALKTAIGANGTPANGATVEAYGATPNLKTPMSFLYSFDIQNELGHQFVVTVGYQGSTGRHYSRLVNQNFLSPNSATVGGKSVSAPFYALYLAHDDSNQYYNALNVHAVKRYRRGISLDATYTFSKSEDQVSNGDGADSSGNQTYPQNNATELGPSDLDVKHRFVATGTYEFSPYHGGSEMQRAAFNGWQLNGIFTAHTGFPWTPVTFRINGLSTVTNTATVSPVRPTSYVGNYSPSCNSAAFRSGTEVSGAFGLGVVGNSSYTPGIGRNSFRGPCYQSLDAGIAKEIKLPFFGEAGLLRLQAQAFNVYNKLNYSPFTFSSSATQLDGGTTVTQANTKAGTPVFATITPGLGVFQRPVSASAGRVVELNARISF